MNRREKCTQPKPYQRPNDRIKLPACTTLALNRNRLRSHAAAYARR
jgi:hypothetical protein